MIVDVHIHVGAPGKNLTECYMSPRFRRSLAFFGILAIQRTLPGQMTVERALATVNDVISGMREVDLGVLLALDAVYDKNGKLCPAATHLYTPNEIVADLANKNSKALFGASIHPNRPDAIELLEACKDKGAVLIKWLPSTQQIDPSNPRYRPFYEKMIALGLPLLSHVGAEHTVPSNLPRREQNRLNSPANLRLPLECGVTVIAAHCAVYSIPWYDPHHFPVLLELFSQAEANGWNLYGDISAFCMPNRMRQVAEVKQKIPPQRLVLGSDYPIPAFRLCHNFSLRRLGTLPKNPIDKNLWLLRDMGFPAQVFTNAATILPL